MTDFRKGLLLGACLMLGALQAAYCMHASESLWTIPEVMGGFSVVASGALSFVCGIARRTH